MHEQTLTGLLHRPIRLAYFSCDVTSAALQNAVSTLLLRYVWKPPLGGFREFT